jgi:hypothetical protein
MLFKLRASATALALTVACALGTGCSSSDGRTEQSKNAVASMSNTRSELNKAKAEVQRANASLDALAAGGNLEPAYKQYTASVSSLKSQGDRARQRGQQMRANQRAYVENWQKEMATISDPDLKAGAAARQQAIKANFDHLSATAQAVGDAYRPYLATLQEIQKALANDLTPAGVDAAKPAMAKASAQGQALSGRIDNLIAELDDMRGGMTAGAQASGGQKSGK